METALDFSRLRRRIWERDGYGTHGHCALEAGDTAADAIYASILDNNHIGFRLGPAEIGGLWEHTKYREENEWKGGIRGAVRVGHGVKFIVQSVWPDWEMRAGLGFER